MCDLCEKAKGSSGYRTLMERMLEEDSARLEYSKEMAQELKPLERTICTTLKWPLTLLFPMFEARAAFSVPQNYFQQLMLDGERLGNAFAHGAMRSMFFWGDQLVVFSKTVGHKKGKDFFTSFVLANFKPGEFSFIVNDEDITIRADMEKQFRNLVTGKAEKRRVSFNFINQKVKSRIVSKEQVVASAQFKSVYSKYGGADVKSASIDLEGYAITVPHFSPHPYLLQLKEQFGYESNRQFQENVVKDYFLRHLKKD